MEAEEICLVLIPRVVYFSTIYFYTRWNNSFWTIIVYLTRAAVYCNVPIIIIMRNIKIIFCSSAERECDELPNPEHGVVQMTGKLFNDKATYSCEIGYQLIGRDHRTCHATGMWSGAEPFCKQSGSYFNFIS